MSPQLFESKHFQIEQLADGVYAAIASEQGYAICNAGIIDIGDRTIIFDTFISPEAARDLLKAAEHLTSSRLTYVINSHDHGDHIRGNQVFGSDVDIVSTPLTLETIARNEPEDIKREKGTITQRISDMQSKLDAEKDPKRRRELSLVLVELHGVSRSHVELKTRLPNITFEQILTIHGTEKTIKLLPLAGHTASDVVLILPKEKIAFMGDLLFKEMHPYLANGSPSKLKKSLSEVESLGVEIAIPGHGPVGNSSDLVMMTQYVQSLEKIVEDMIKTNRPIEYALLEPAPKPFDAWLNPDNFFISNLRFLYKIATQREP